MIRTSDWGGSRKIHLTEILCLSNSSLSPLANTSSLPPTSIVPTIHPLNEKVTAVDKKNSSTTPSNATDDGHKMSSTTTAESSADQPATPPNRHQIQRQEGHESKDRDPVLQWYVFPQDIYSPKLISLGIYMCSPNT